MTGGAAAAGHLRGIHHVGIAVHDLDEAIDRYVRQLGATLELRAEVADQQVAAASLHAGDGCGLVELIAPLGDDAPLARFLDRRGPGLHHVAYAVDDVAAALSALRGQGVRLVDEVPRIGLHGTEVAFVHPSAMLGVLTELVQVAPGTPG